MAEFTETKTLGDLQKLFNKLKNVYYSASSFDTPEAFFTAGGMELPILSDGVTFNTGQPSITKIKLTTGATWTSMADAGDSDISFQVATVADDINAIFLNKRTASPVTTGATTIAGNTYKGDGYDLEPKKVSGSMLFVSEDRQCVVVMLNIEAYANLQVETAKPSYYTLQVTPLRDTKGAALYILHKSSE